MGVYATYTWTDSNIELSETFNSGRFGLDGQSKHLGNVTLHYHRDKFGARTSYRYRSEFTRPQRPARAFTVNRAEGDLSFQVSYDFNKQFRLFVEGWGLLNEARDNFHGLEGPPRAIYAVRQEYTGRRQLSVLMMRYLLINSMLNMALITRFSRPSKRVSVW